MFVFYFYMPEVIYRALVRDAENPAEKVTLPVELLGIPHCCKKRVLQQILRYFPVAGHSHKETEHPVFVPLVKRGEPGRVSLHPLVEKNMIFEQAIHDYVRLKKIIAFFLKVYYMSPRSVSAQV